MRKYIPTLVIVCSAGLATIAAAQQSAGLVRTAVEDAMNGTCSQVLSTMVRTACQQQMPGMQQRLSQLGKIKEVKYQGQEQTPQGSAEVFLVIHEKGSLAWMAIAENGRLRVFWTPG